MTPTSSLVSSDKRAITSRAGATPMGGSVGQSVTLAIYDEQCRTCSGFAKVLDLLDTRQKLRLLPAGAEEARTLVPEADLRRTFHAVHPGGTILVHGEALVAVLGALPGLAWLPNAIMARPRARRFANRVYGWLARNRGWLSYLA